MALLQSALARIGSLSQTLQILLILPLTLDFLGPPSFLLLSLLLTLHQFTYSTLRLALKNTIAAPLIPVFNVFNPLFPPLSALVVCWLYLRSEGSISSAPLSSQRWRELLMDKLPGWYAFSLRIAAPVFSLLEGFATLLVRLKPVTAKSGIAADLHLAGTWFIRSHSCSDVSPKPTWTTLRPCRPTTTLTRTLWNGAGWLRLSSALSCTALGSAGCSR